MSYDTVSLYTLHQRMQEFKFEQAIFTINVKTSPLEAEIVTEVLNSEVAQTILQQKFALTKQANALFDAVFDCQSKPAVYLF